MKKLALSLSLALASLLASTSFAQTPGPGGDKAVAVPSATPAQKAAAKQSRIVEGKSVAKTAQPGDERPATAATGKKVSKADKQAAKAKRKVAGAEAVKSKEKVAP